MSVLVDKNTRLVVQGITGSAGAFHTRQCIEYGTNVVAGVTPGKGGQMFDGKVPVFDTVWEAGQRTNCNVSVIFVPAAGAADSILEAVDAGVEVVVCITEGMSDLDVVKHVNDDPKTDAMILIGEIGGSAEEEAAAWIKENCRKPVAAFIAGATAPPGRRMGHAGAIVSGGKGTAAGKIEALKAAGIAVAETPATMADTLISRMEGKA